ncbi:Bromodomain-containing protein [Lindgomyces ingoldianus]|uniref:Bromodomain-containing protein n=1 Tax=Lindgomyces ingoldianus TaxID=673940 RepID=A0ACB6QUK3_9PLEO|nr:Bromodomain-containing protein [Lindgomyces ingoldianus]KAF2470688.1 Bromodomain-containing protein [Lindgomyces ingoldianus]
MAVMTSSALEKISFEAKAASFTSADEMVLDTEANGISHKYDVLFGGPDFNTTEPTAQPAVTESEPHPTVNGNHMPATAVSNTVEPSIQFLADSQPDTNSLFDSPEVGATSLATVVGAPTSDVREEALPGLGAQSSDNTQLVPETQQQAADFEFGSLSNHNAMDVSQEASVTAPASIPPTNSMTELSIQTQSTTAEPSQMSSFVQSPTNLDLDMGDAPLSGRVRSREDDDEEADAPEAKRTRTDEEMGGRAEFKIPELPAHSEQANGNGIVSTGTADQTPVQAAVSAEDWPLAPMTTLQNKFLLERVRNTKKIKVAHAFKEPVNPEAMGIPQYREYVKNPMDLSTMESKLKEGKYSTVRDFMADLDLIIDNSVTFNGKEHPVTQAGYNMRAYFLKGMGKMPRAGIEESSKQPKPKKPVVATSTKTRRESRTISTTAKSPAQPTPTAASPQSAWPLTADGLPLIRRDSSSANDRPKREIHRPPPKDLPYNSAKPKKKKFAQELKFCESVMTELMRPKYQKFSYPFLKPVDPVALNIPTYLKIIKKPMDFGTIEKNLQAGQYQTAKDFYNDAQLVFANCYKFNIEGDDVHKMGKEMNQLFDRLWAEKAAWLQEHAPASDHQSPGSAYSDEDEDEEDDEEPDAQAQILAIQQQIAALNETAQALLQHKQGKRTSPKVTGKKKAVKTTHPKKKGSLVVPPPPKAAKSKARSKAPAPLSFAQKQEISDGISTLGDADMRKAVQIIRNGCPHLASGNDDEMEIDMDEIDDNTLRDLFKFIKQVRGPKGVVDDDFEPPRPHKGAAHRKTKNKPMGKQEQEDSIKRIQEKLRTFAASASGSSQSPPAAQDESSDDESSGSESEEE